MMPASYKLGDQFPADSGLPPWDGTGIPLPVDEDGWPVIPDEDQVLKITEPAEGATVDPLTDVKGTAPGRNGEDIELWVESSPGAAVATTQVANGQFTFEGSTPFDTDPTVIWVVAEDGTESAHRTFHLEDEAPSAAEPQAGESEPAADEGFDPSENTVAEVQAYLADNPDQTDYVLERERSGKNRTTLTGGA